jgi:tetratricopeptide (TPR) repeat protein
VSENQLRLNERLHVKTGYVYLYRVRDLKQASREAQLALHQAEEFMGLVAEEQGRYSEAIRHYEAALALAQRVDNGEGAQAATHSHLGHLHMRRGDAAQAIGHLEIALKHAHHVGQPVHALYHRLNLASALIVAGRHAEAIAQAEEASTLAEAIGNSFLVAGLQAARAEAHLGLGDLIAAEAAAQRSLREEEDVHRAYALTVLGRAQAARDVEAAKATLRMAIESAVDTHDKYAEAHAWRGLADVEHGEAAEQARQRAERLFAELRAE